MALNSLHRWLDRIGDWNPQLLREWKGRLNRTTTLLAIVLALALQGISLLIFLAGLPSNPAQLTSVGSPYSRLGTFPDLVFQVQGQDVTIQEVYGPVAISPQVSTEPDPALGRFDQPLPDIEAGDRVIAIDGRGIDTLLAPANNDSPNPDFWNTASNQGQEFIESLIRGQGAGAIGTTVRLTLQRPGQANAFTVDLTRAWVMSEWSPYCLSALVGPPLTNRYSGGSKRCSLSADGTTYQINWALWYQNFFSRLLTLSSSITLGLGAFLLLDNLSQEVRRGTLALLQLSPRTGQEILLGKILGVPIALYLGVGLTLPTLTYLGLQAGVSPLELGLFGAISLGRMALLLSGTMLIGMLGQGVARPFLFILSAGLGLADLGGFLLLTNTNSFINPIAHLLTDPLFPLPYFPQSLAPTDEGIAIVQILILNPWGRLFYSAIILGFLGRLTLGVWHTLERRYSIPHQVLLKRYHSYRITVAFGVVMLWGVSLIVAWDNQVSITTALRWLLSWMGLLLFFLSLALTPRRQTLQDWARFAPDRSRPISADTPASITAAPPPAPQYRWQVLLQNDQSPPAIALISHTWLLATLALGWCGCQDLLFRSRGGLFWPGAILVVGCTTMAVAYGLLGQSVFLAKRRQSGPWAVGVVIACFCAQTIGSLILESIYYSLDWNTWAGLSPTGTFEDVFELLRMAIAPWMVGSGLEGLAPEKIQLISLGILGPVSAVFGLSALHWHQFSRLGHSESYKLLNSQKS